MEKVGESRGALKRICRHIDNLGDPDGKVASKAEACLIRYYGARAADRLLGACFHPDPAVRFRAGWALAHTGDARALEALLRLTEDCDERVRYDATVALGILADPRALEHIVRIWMLEDETRPAGMALSRLGGKAFPVLRDALKHPSARIRLEAVCLLGGIGDRRSLALVRERLEDADPLVREEALYYVEGGHSGLGVVS